MIGSGPAGLAAAQQLTARVTPSRCSRRADRIGGLLRYGIPDFKLEKWVIDRRLEQIREEGVVVPDRRPRRRRPTRSATCAKNFDAVLLCIGAEQPRDLEVPGRELAGVHFAMEFLAQQNRRVAGDVVAGAGRRSSRPESTS